ncbi:hypothetical protein WJU16_18215 [Chitinophaga pollutisoli]|uniref:Uncharacterized protein n=1 Tax=Chitinophaga pollutisoli TaxID=3133966 RepID=A0ABZ2YJL1_9BACT
MAICLLALTSVHFGIRVTGYMQCVVKAYMIDHRDFAQDCGCAKIMAAVFGNALPGEEQMTPAPTTLKLQDIVLLAESPRTAAPRDEAKPFTGWVQERYPSPAAGAIFHPPC